MTTATFPNALPAVESVRRGRFVTAIRDMVAIAWRNFTSLKRTPQFLVFSLIQPVIFVLMFRYVFGGAIAIPGFPYPYVDYLMPGIFAQTVVFGAIGTAVGLATDLQSGLIERFRSLPMARSALLTGRTLTDTFRNFIVILLMFFVGFLVGMRIHTNFMATLAAIAILLIFGYSFSWIFACVGLFVGDPETAQVAAFPVMAPLVFASNAFVPVESMPTWLQGWATHQPVSVTISAVRALLNGGETAPYVWGALAWSAVIVAIAAPLAVRRYRASV